MSTPFSGMEPYLEHRNIWPDFHHSLAYEIRAQLAPRLRPRYFAAVEVQVTYDQVTITLPERIKPDVSVMQLREAPSPYTVAIPPAPVIGQTVLEEEINLFRVEIREVGIGRLVTSIEILAPVNKRRGHEAFE